MVLGEYNIVTVAAGFNLRKTLSTRRIYSFAVAFLRLLRPFLKDKLSTWGIYAFAVVAPFSNAGMEIVIGCMVLVWLLRMVVERQILFRWNYLNVFILLYLAVMIVSGIFSARPLQSALGVKEEWIILLYFAIINTMLSRKVFLNALKVLAVSCSIVGIYAVWQHFYGYDLKHGEMLLEHSGYFRSAGFFGLCLTFGGFYVIACTSILGSFIGTSALRDRLLFGIPAAILFFAVIASYTRSSWIGAAVGSILLTFVHHWKTGVIYLLIFLLVWLGIYIFHPGLITDYGVASIVDPDYSEGSEVRMDLWDKGLEMWKDNPVLGLGPGNFTYYHDAYNFPEHIYGYHHLHNEILNVAVQMGILGVIAFLGMWVVFIVECFRFWKRERERDPHAAASVLGCAGAVAGILAGGMFQCFYTDIEVGMLWWFIVGLASAVILLPTETFETGK